MNRIETNRAVAQLKEQILVGAELIYNNIRSLCDSYGGEIRVFEITIDKGIDPISLSDYECGVIYPQELYVDEVDGETVYLRGYDSDGNDIGSMDIGVLSIEVLIDFYEFLYKIV